jgi:hypothetical protein
MYTFDASKEAAYLTSLWMFLFCSIFYFLYHYANRQQVCADRQADCHPASRPVTDLVIHRDVDNGYL